ncbi:IQ motif and SEC7 domain-containing protein 2 [Armadillidium vulgare]|nr:IQ motif and SEC7 domain-containing protein 2 [Armadillidium vulgare]
MVLLFSSSSSKVDRPYCGPGPPGRNRPLCGPISKAHSLDVPSLLNKSHHHVPVANGSHHHLVRRPQAVSQSAVMGGSRHGLSPRGVAVDDCGSRSDRWRRNGSQSAGQSYELSQDLADKRLEMLERRYGGERARRAATTIQRAYRHYAMHKKFRAITATAKAQEKRLSRRFTLESSEWIEGSGNGHTCDAEQRIRSEFDKLNRNLNASVYGVDSNRRPSRSLSMRDSRTCPNARGEMTN